MSVPKPTLGLIILGIAITIGITLFIGACSLAESWWALFAIIPTLLAFLSSYGMYRTSDPSFPARWIGFDGWVFLLTLSLGSSLGLVVVIWHLNNSVANVLIMYLIGWACISAGYVASIVLITPE
jgi:hypothetical protein